MLTRTLKVLVKLHLSRENARYWGIDGSNFTIFAHPTLRSLTLSCAHIPDNLTSMLRDRPRTPLRQLVLIECNIQSNSILGNILALPAALEHLSLGENCRHTWLVPVDWNQLFGRDETGFIAALRQQRESLQSFGYATQGATPMVNGGSTVLDPREHAGLSVFHNLTRVSVADGSAKFEDLFKSAQTAPPALQRLTLHRMHWEFFYESNTTDRESDRTFMPWIPVIAATIDSLRTLILIADSVDAQGWKLLLPELQQALEGRDLTVRSWKRLAHRKMPPYLYQEVPHLDEETAVFENGRLREIPGLERQPVHDSCLLYS